MTLLREVNTFLKKTGMAATKLGKVSLNDPNFVLDLRKGRDYRASTALKIRNFMGKHDAKSKKSTRYNQAKKKAKT